MKKLVIFATMAVCFLLVLASCGGSLPAPAPPPTPETVVFPDKNLEKAIRTALDKPAGEAMTPAEMAELTELITSHQGITDLSGIEYCTNLTLLDFGSNQISDLSPLVSLTNLAILQLSQNQISDISPLASLTNLDYLVLS